MTTFFTELLKDSAYKLDQFKQDQIEQLESAISWKQSGKKSVPYVNCIVRGKPIKLTPEEAIRQLYLLVLRDDLGYPLSRMELEYSVTFGREKKRADICIFDKDKTTTPYILVELKKPKLKDGKEQLKSYCNATGAPMGVWTNGQQISYYHRKDPNYFEDIPAIPSAHEKLSDILSERWTIDDLVKLDKLVNERKSLKDLILEMEDEVLANAGVDVFEELFKLIFTKLFDEMESGQDKKRHLVFKNYGDTESELKAKIQDLFEKAQGTWEGVFPENAKIELTPSHLAVCVSSLEKVKLFNSNLEVVDEAFEYLINKSSKGEKGQYFTPRYVIDMCVKMMNPQEHETLIDTASGSCGFPVHGIFHVWEQIRRDLGDPTDHLFTTQKKTGRYAKYVVDKVFGIDFDEKAVRVGRTLNLIAGDGQTNVLHLNTLDYERWFEKTGDDDNPGDRDWQDIYGDGWKRLRKLRATKKENRDFKFDVLMANPPFAGDIKETRILARYDLARSVSFDKINKVDPEDPNIVDATSRNPSFPEALHASHEVIYQLGDGTFRKVKVKNQNKVGRDILFIERNLQFLKPGGRMAVVLPQGRFNNASDKALREYLAEHGRILAVVGLHGNVFKPHTGTKTSVLFIQKWNDDPAAGPLCPKVDDYPIFFATMQEPSKDNSGDKIYRAERHCMSAKQVAEIEKLQAKWLKIDKEEQKLREVENNQKITAKQQARLAEIESLRNSSKDELEKVAINLDAPKLDNHGHLIVKHDLFNHDGLTGDGIAEAFCEFAKKEGLSFFR
ncbi:type I restriction enzyme HsdR N-terminal domain-containing protein [Vibrio fluvialis]|uniref:type I restriction enzyme HsdR N-terminal domain-containing protein n=1 Tax=Vibrio fluvialis TaxID=676 RepID=UPI00192B0033|nr:type I restriction enzyme HsdR N-terminal domain-containing protein [Vibrio fluvialis]MBL4295543.1 type I restriction enzyme HsdR N-terminal domain-containing protein [Vibrio fluvialis]MBY8192054.1 type I restriction enzyme HsdR N-terminal domain-containing protein [Vibrio fluvialis]